LVTSPCSSFPAATPSANSWKGSGCIARSESLASRFHVSNWRNWHETRCPIWTMSDASSKRCQASSGMVMKPTPGKTGCAGPSSSATNTPNGSIAATVPDSVSP
jgi:hypothetical protein